MQGNLLLNEQERISRWKEHFNNLLNVPSNLDSSIIRQIPIPVLSPAENFRQDKPPSLAEVQQAIKQTESGKSPGNDNISSDVLKTGGVPMAAWLHEIFIDIWQSEKMVDDWTTAILIRIYKGKGDKQLCDNYRGISLLVVASKVFSRVILNRVQSLLDKQLLEEQAGFRSNRSTIDQIFSLKMTMERSREHNKPLFMCFVDIQKAYGSVNRDLLWQICRHYGLTEKIVRMLQLLYKDTKAQVRVSGELSDTFNIDTGVLQGGIPSCVLFNILFDFVMRRVLDKTKQLGVTGIKLAYGSNDFHHTNRDRHEDLDVLALMYADDLVTMCDNEHDLEMFIRTFEQVTQEFGLTMSIKKTCIMSLKQLQEDTSRRVLKGKEVVRDTMSIHIRNQTIETVDQFSYLGFHINRDQSMDEEIETRLSKASAAFNMLRHVIWYRRAMSIQAKLRIFRACVLPVLPYVLQAEPPFTTLDVLRDAFSLPRSFFIPGWISSLSRYHVFVRHVISSRWYLPPPTYIYICARSMIGRVRTGERFLSLLLLFFCSHLFSLDTNKPPWPSRHWSSPRHRLLDSARPLTFWCRDPSPILHNSGSNQNHSYGQSTNILLTGTVTIASTIEQQEEVPIVE